MERRDAVFLGVTAALLAVGAGFELLRPKRFPPVPIITPPLPAPVLPKTWVVMGDSIGVGMAAASGSRSVAVVGTRMTDSTRRAKQIAALRPEDTNIVISLGTNDAAAHLADPTEAVKLWLIALRSRRITNVIWCGPIHPTTVLATLCRNLDADLAVIVPKNGAHYVSLYQPSLDKFHGAHGDGIHYTNGGYAALWKLAMTRTVF